MTTQDTIELLYESFRENPTRLTYSTKTLCKQFAAEPDEVKHAKKLYRLNPNDFIVAQSMCLMVDESEDYVWYGTNRPEEGKTYTIPASKLFDTLNREKFKKALWLNDIEKCKLIKPINPFTGEDLFPLNKDGWGKVTNQGVDDSYKELRAKLLKESLNQAWDSNQNPYSDEWEVKQKWVKGPEGSQLMVKKDSSQDLEILREQILRDVKQYAPKYKKTKPESNQGGNLLVISCGDIHLGKLSVKSETGEDYNVDIAYNRAIEGVKGLIQKASGFSIDTVLLIIGNDILHTDTLDRKTTNKTPQDTDGMWHENFLRAKDLYVEVIEMLMPLGNVYVQFNDSNHDRMSGFFLAQTIEAWFRNSDITFDVTMKPRKYFQYGVNLIGTSHGESKEADLPLIMATECPEEWGTSTKRYWYCHHIHHKKSKEYMGVCVEYLRSPSGTDAWHSRNGYLSNKAIEAFIHDVQEGQICRLTQYS